MSAIKHVLYREVLLFLFRKRQSPRFVAASTASKYAGTFSMIGYYLTVKWSTNKLLRYITIMMFLNSMINNVFINQRIIKICANTRINQSPPFLHDSSPLFSPPFISKFLRNLLIAIFENLYPPLSREKTLWICNFI